MAAFPGFGDIEVGDKMMKDYELNERNLPTEAVLPKPDILSKLTERDVVSSKRSLFSKDKR